MFNNNSTVATHIPSDEHSEVMNYALFKDIRWSISVEWSVTSALILRIWIIKV